MDRAHTTGMVLIGVAAVQFVVFLVAVLRRSYLAIALPVAAAMTTLTALTFWVGWTMMTMEEEPDEPPIIEAQ